jgi:hypothetical protein
LAASVLAFLGAGASPALRIVACKRHLAQFLLEWLSEEFGCRAIT